MTSTSKVLIFLGMFLVLGALAMIIYNQHQLSLQQKAIQDQQIAQKQLIDGVMRSQTDWATKQDINNLLSANGLNAAALKSIQDDMSVLKANMTTANVVTVDSRGQNKTGQPSSSTGTQNPNPPGPTPVGCPNPDPFGFMRAEQDYQLHENFGNVKVPIGSVGFSAWQQNPWSIHILPREYTVDSVIGTDENQRNVVYNQVNIKEGNNVYTVPITTSKTLQVFPSPKFSFWNPRLLLGADGGINLNHVRGEFSPSISVGLMSYGRYKTTPDFSVLELGAAWQSVNQKPALVITPVAYNIGRNLFSPLMNNTYVGPSVSMAADGSWTFSAGLRVGF